MMVYAQVVLYCSLFGMVDAARICQKTLRMIAKGGASWWNIVAYIDER